MRRYEDIARLYLDDVEVGAVHVHSFDDAWGFGDFVPEPGYALFAPHFQRWSQLMHADAVGDPVCTETSEALREVECAIDSIGAKLYLVNADEWRTITQLNIDGSLIEWREDRAAPCKRACRAETCVTA